MWRKLYVRLRALFARSRVEAELDEEIRFHLDRLTEQHIQRGMEPEAARRAAIRAFGGVERHKEAARDARGVRPIQDLFADVRYALRLFRRNPGFTVVTLAVLGLGLGANTTIFTVVDTVLLRPLPYPDSDRLVKLWQSSEHGRGWVSAPNFLDWRSATDEVFQGLAAFTPTSVNLAGGAEPVRARGYEVTRGFFDLLGVEPVLGRTFVEDEFSPGEDRVALLDAGLWRRRFGADSSVVGRTVDLNGEPRVVVGVIPADLTYPTDAEVWIPRPLYTADWQRRRGIVWLQVLGRVAPGVSDRELATRLDVIARRLEAEHPETNAGTGIAVVGLKEELVGDARPALLVLSGAVGVLLLLICGNVANLFLARATRREREMAIRSAIGGSRGRIARQLLTETTVLALAGGLLGTPLSVAGVSAFVSLAPANIPRLAGASVDARVLVFTLALATLTGLIFGLAPAVRVVGTRLAEALKAGAPERMRGSSRGRRLRSGLAVGQLAIAVVLTAGAALLARSFWELRSVDPGFRTEGVLSMVVPLTESRYDEDADQRRFFERLIRRLADLPGVEAVGAVNNLPLSGSSRGTGFRPGGPGARGSDEEFVAAHRIATPGYFRALEIPVVAGRVFDARDDADAPAVALIDETLARRHWGGDDPVGDQILIGDDGSRRIVGVVGSVRSASLAGEPDQTIYVPFAQSPVDVMGVALRTTGDPGALAAVARRQVYAIDPAQPVFALGPLDTYRMADLAQPRFIAMIVALFAAAALGLAALGIYGLMSFLVASRRGEIGLRLAVGAAPGDVLGLELRRALRLALLGLGLGLAGALAAGRYLSSVLFRVDPIDPITLLVLPPILGAVALSAALLPAWRASRVDPALALRNE